MLIPLSLRPLALGSANPRRSLGVLILVVMGVVTATALVVDSYLASFPDAGASPGQSRTLEADLTLPGEPTT